jgi:tetratricopeptide (TPR) repeat protein
MTPTPDPYAPHLRQAENLYAQGEIVKAGQIWQAILRQHPVHAEARAGLLAVKERLLALREAEAEAAAFGSPAPEPAPDPPAGPVAPPAFDPRSTAAPGSLSSVVPRKVTTGALDPEHLLAEGCTLYDMGQTQDALRKWEQVLTLAPDHALARGYANGARRELGLAPHEAPAAPAAVQVEDHYADEDVDKLLREAVQLYDMGLVEEAITKWERALALEPQRQEIEGYLRQARTEVATAVSSAPVAAPAPSAAPEPDALDLKLRQAEHLLTLQRHEEAAFTFQQALGLDPGNARARQGLMRCGKPSGTPAPAQAPTPDPRATATPSISLDSQGRIAMAVEAARPATEPQGIEPPAALLKAAPAPRLGLSLPQRLREATEQLPLLKGPKTLAGLGGGVLVVGVSLALVHGYRKDQALKDEVLAVKATAVAPVVQQAQAPELGESPEAIRQEAEITLGTDPLRAYLRAETLVNRNPGDAAAAQLLEKARAGLGGGATGASLPEFQKHLQAGDLEAALKVMDGLLRAEPGDAALRARAARLDLTLCLAHASQAKWDLAQEDLQRGRALFPGDKKWQARLRLLDQVKAMPKLQQPSWIALLG